MPPGEYWQTARSGVSGRKYSRLCGQFRYLYLSAGCSLPVDTSCSTAEQTANCWESGRLASRYSCGKIERAFMRWKVRIPSASFTSIDISDSDAIQSTANSRDQARKVKKNKKKTYIHKLERTPYCRSRGNSCRNLIKLH